MPLYGNKDVKEVIEREYFLTKFIKKLPRELMFNYNVIVTECNIM